MKLLKRISSTILMSALVSAMFWGMTAFASMPMKLTPRATGQDQGTNASLEVSCSTDSISVKFTKKTSSSHYCEVIGYLKDYKGNEFPESDALFASGNVNGGKSISDAKQRTDVYTISASGSIYKGASATTGMLEHLDLVVGRR